MGLFWRTLLLPLAFAAAADFINDGFAVADFTDSALAEERALDEELPLVEETIADESWNSAKPQSLGGSPGGEQHDVNCTFHSLVRHTKD